MLRTSTVLCCMSRHHMLLAASTATKHCFVQYAVAIKGRTGLLYIKKRFGMKKVYPDARAALADILKDGQTIAVGGFGLCGIPEALIAAVRDLGIKDLTAISNNAGGSGIPAFFTKTGVGTIVAEGKEVREFDGEKYVMERSLVADVSLVKAYMADKAGNLVYRKTARNFNPNVAMAGKITVAEVEKLVEVGEIDPNEVHTPSIFVHRIIIFFFLFFC